MSETELNGIKQRIERLEKENRLVKTVGVVCALVVAMVLLAGAAQSTEKKEITVRRLTVTDDEGTKRVQLSADKWGERLQLFDPNESLRASFASGFGGGGLTFWAIGDSTDVQRFENPLIDIKWLQFGAIGLGSETSLSLRNLDKNTKSMFTLSSEGPNLSMEDAEGFMSSLGTTSLEVEGTGETRRTSAASLVMFGKEGKVIWRAPQESRNE